MPVRDLFDRLDGEEFAVRPAFELGSLCQGVEQAVRATGTTDNAKLIEWLHARTAEDPVKTVLGDFYWDERGLPINRVPLMVQWQDQKLEFVYPTEGMGDLIKPILYPKPDWN